MITAGSATPAWGSQSLTLQRQSIGGHGAGGGAMPPCAPPAPAPRHRSRGHRRAASPGPATFPSCLETQHHPLPSQHGERLRPAQAPSTSPLSTEPQGWARCHTVPWRLPGLCCAPGVGASTQHSAQGQLDPCHLRANRSITQAVPPTSSRSGTRSPCRRCRRDAAEAGGARGLTPALPQHTSDHAGCS